MSRFKRLHLQCSNIRDAAKQGTITSGLGKATLNWQDSFSRYQQTRDLLHFMQALKGVSENLSQVKRSPSDLLLTPILSMLIALNLYIVPQLRFPWIKFKNPKPKNPTIFFPILLFTWRALIFREIWKTQDWTSVYRWQPLKCSFTM